MNEHDNRRMERELLTTQGRKLLVALATVLVSVLIAAIPELEGLHDDLVSIVVIVLIAVLGTIPRAQYPP